MYFFQMANYLSAVDRIKRAKTAKDLKRVRKGFSNDHAVGLLSDNQLSRLDIMICDKLSQVEAIQ